MLLGLWLVVTLFLSDNSTFVLLDLGGGKVDPGRVSDWPNKAERSAMVADHGPDGFEPQHGMNLS